MRLETVLKATFQAFFPFATFISFFFIEDESEWAGDSRKIGALMGEILSFLCSLFLVCLLIFGVIELNVLGLGTMGIVVLIAIPIVSRWIFQFFGFFIGDLVKDREPVEMDGPLVWSMIKVALKFAFVGHIEDKAGEIDFSKLDESPGSIQMTEVRLPLKSSVRGGDKEKRELEDKQEEEREESKKAEELLHSALLKELHELKEVERQKYIPVLLQHKEFMQEMAKGINALYKAKINPDQYVSILEKCPAQASVLAWGAIALNEAKRLETYKKTLEAVKGERAKVLVEGLKILQDAGIDYPVILEDLVTWDTFFSNLVSPKVMANEIVHLHVFAIKTHVVFPSLLYKHLVKAITSDQIQNIVRGVIGLYEFCESKGISKTIRAEWCESLLQANESSKEEIATILGRIKEEYEKHVSTTQVAQMLNKLLPPSSSQPLKK